MLRSKRKTPRGDSLVVVKPPDTIPKVPLQQNPRDLRRLQKEKRKNKAVSSNTSRSFLEDDVLSCWTSERPTEKVSNVVASSLSSDIRRQKNRYHQIPIVKQKPKSAFSLFSKAINIKQPDENSSQANRQSPRSPRRIPTVSKCDSVFEKPQSPRRNAANKSPVNSSANGLREKPSLMRRTLSLSQPHSKPNSESTVHLPNVMPENSHPLSVQNGPLTSTNATTSKRKLAICGTPHNTLVTRAMQTPARLILPRKRSKLIMKTQRRSITPPMDWSLNSMVRFISPYDFDWCKGLKSHIHPRGLSNALRCIHDEELLTDYNFDDRDMEKLYDRASAELQKALIYWVFNPQTKDDEDWDDMQSTFETSLCSLYEQMQCKLCPYFYIQAKAFTILFVGEGLGGCTQRTARVSSSTPGLRALLADEGIAFDMPHWEDDSGNRLDNYLSGSEGEEDKDGIEYEGIDTVDDIEAATQSQSGYDGGTYSANPSDGTSKSMLLFKGQDVSLFYNFLVNGEGGSHIVSTALYAPSPFSKATLETLKIRRNRPMAGAGQDAAPEFRFEIEGPVMPLCLNRITRLFTTTQDATFKVELSPYSHCKGLNVHASSNDSKLAALVKLPPRLPTLSAEDSLTLANSCGITTTELRALSCPPSAELASVRRIECTRSDEPYVWMAS
eukprot:CFRG6264T1